MLFPTHLSLGFKASFRLQP